MKYTQWKLQHVWVHKIDHLLVTKTYRIIKTGSDDPAIPLNGSYSSFRSSLNLNVDLCSKDVSTLEQKQHMKCDLLTEQGEKK